jgi:MFS family permease
MAASSSLESEALAWELSHGVAFPFYWAATLNAPACSTTWWWPGPPSREPAADDGCVGLTALDLELVGFVYEVLVEPVDCTICGARLDPAISIQLTGGYASAGRAVAPSLAVLVAARIVQGVGAALVVPSSLALLNGTLRVPDWAPGIGICAGLASLGGLLIGRFVGGWLVDHASWRAVFFLNVRLIGGALLALLPVPGSVATRGRFSLDAVLLAVLVLPG